MFFTRKNKAQKTPAIHFVVYTGYTWAHRHFDSVEIARDRLADYSKNDIVRCKNAADALSKMKAWNR